VANCGKCDYAGAGTRCGGFAHAGYCEYPSREGVAAETVSDAEASATPGEPMIAARYIDDTAVLL
jgi:hypothetical protein